MKNIPIPCTREPGRALNPNTGERMCRYARPEKRKLVDPSGVLCLQGRDQKNKMCQPTGKRKNGALLLCFVFSSS